VSNLQLTQSGRVILPVFTNQQALSRTFVYGKDKQGLYVACRLGNRNPSKFYGWYVLVSPEDLALMKEFNWCGTISDSTDGRARGIEIRRRTSVGGIRCSIMLGREIWSRTYAGEVPILVYRLGHPLDFRRVNLSQFPLEKGLRGITKHKDAWQVQITIGNESHYIGRAAYPDEGYRMFNRYLKGLKEQRSGDARIQAIPYNEVEPQF